MKTPLTTQERIKRAVRDPESAEAAYRRRINAMLEQIDLVGLHLVYNLLLSLRDTHNKNNE